MPSVVIENGLACHKTIDYKIGSDRPQAPEEANVMGLFIVIRIAF